MDPGVIFLKLSVMTRKEKLSAADAIMLEAKKKAKALMAKHHPDRGGDAEAFKSVSASVDMIEKHTMSFKIGIQKKIDEAAEKAANSVHIEIEK
jgi:hypothetical protein